MIINRRHAAKDSRLPMLLFEHNSLLRRTVSLTARLLSLGEVCDTGNLATARRLLKERTFGGAIISLDIEKGAARQYDLSFIDEIRSAKDARMAYIPIAVMVPHCDEALLDQFKTRNITRIILKPFRARVLLDTFIEFSAEAVRK